MPRIKRGRDYLNETSGATEFFDEVKSVLQQQQLNPVFDSVLEQNALFAPELAMLDRAGRSLSSATCGARAARSSTCRNPRRLRPTSSNIRASWPSTISATHPTSTPNIFCLPIHFAFRPTASILRDPECLLFKEWARVDWRTRHWAPALNSPPLPTPTAGPTPPTNKTDYQFSIDPERANGRHLVHRVVAAADAGSGSPARARSAAVVIGAASHHAICTLAPHDAREACWPIRGSADRANTAPRGTPHRGR